MERRPVHDEGEAYEPGRARRGQVVGWSVSALLWLASCVGGPGLDPPRDTASPDGPASGGTGGSHGGGEQSDASVPRGPNEGLMGGGGTGGGTGGTDVAIGDDGSPDAGMLDAGVSDAGAAWGE